MKLQILTDPCLKYFDLFRLTGANKEWRSFIDGSGETPELIFLPRLSKTRNPIIRSSSLGSNQALIHTSWSLPHRLRVKFVELEAAEKHVTDVMAPPWPRLRIHPLLEGSLDYYFPRYDRSNGERLESELYVSYQLIKHMNSFSEASAKWRQTLITQPPLERLSLNIPEWKFGTPGYYYLPWYTQKSLKGQKGVTLGDVFDAAWKSLSPHTAGLVQEVLCPFP